MAKEQTRPRISFDEAAILKKCEEKGITSIDDFNALFPKDFDGVFPDFPDGQPDLPDELEIHAKNLLVLGDIHITSHDNTALAAAVNYGRQQNVDTILLNGDIMDFPTISRFRSKLTAPTVMQEVKLAGEFLSWLRRAFPSAKIIFKKGNHDERLENYIIDHAAKLDGLANLNDLLRLSEHGIIAAEDLQLIKCGNLYLYHGHEFRRGGIHFAHNILHAAMTNVAVNHFHRTQYAAGRTLSGKDVACWGIGCLCILNKAYKPFSKEPPNHGFAVIRFENSGDFEFQNKRIIYGKVV